MTTDQKRWHLRTWRLVGPAVILGLIAALNARPSRSIHSPLPPQLRAVSEGILGKVHP